ncbi:MAG: NAD(+) synthase [Tissierellia bacterium]|nr:NAD(+) synthase [Tissierellia bacterium]
MKKKLYLAFPSIKLASPLENGPIIQKLLDQGQDGQLIIFPALSLTGDGLGDLNMQPSILAASLEALNNLSTKVPALIGLPIEIDDRLFSVMAYLEGDRVLGYYPIKSKEAIFCDPQLFPSDKVTDIELFDLSIYLDDEFNTPYQSYEFPTSPSLYLGCPESYSISGGIHSSEYYFSGNVKESARWNQGLVGLEVKLNKGLLKIHSYKEVISTIEGPYPFLRKSRDYQALLDFQARAYGNKLVRTGLAHSVIGISGGLDSTWALIALKRAHELMDLPLENIHCIVMPGFGSSQDTMDSATNFLKYLGFKGEVISIDTAVLQHFRDLNHDPKVMNLVYENSQARERTQILMDLANKYNGLVVGTGDMSEIALGWSTYNGDQMSMYGINASIPKTLIKDLIFWYASNSEEDLKKSLLHILGRPISPELLPPDEKGAIIQKTEEQVGKYEIVDLILYHFLMKKDLGEIYKNLESFYPQLSPKEIKDNLARFFSRFISQQFKRTASPHGVKLTSPSILDFEMAADLTSSYFLKEIEKL